MSLDSANVLYFGVAAVFGALFGGLSQILVSMVQSALARRAISKGLLAEVRASCALAARHAHWLSAHLLADWKTQSKSRQFIRHFRTPIWDAAVKTTAGLASAHLDRLVAFHSYLEAIDGKFDAYLAEQDRLAQALNRTDETLADSIQRAMRLIAETSQQMCAALAPYGGISSLDGLPLEYPDTFSSPVARAEKPN